MIIRILQWAQIMKKTRIKKPPMNNNCLIPTVTLNKEGETIVGVKTKKLGQLSGKWFFWKNTRVRRSNVIIDQEDRKETFM